MEKLAEYGAYVGFRCVAWVCGLLPELVARRLGEMLGYGASFLMPRRLARAERHMRRVMGEKAAARRAARRCFASYGRYWAEMFWIRRWRTAGVLNHVSVEGLEHLEMACRAGRGVVVAMPHLGNFEVCSLVARQLGLQSLGVAETLWNRPITQWFLRWRRAMGIQIVLTGDPNRRALLDHLGNGGLVGLMADRDVTRSGIDVTFFGERTRLPAGPVRLALRTGAPLLPAASYFRDGRGHRLVIRPPLILPENGSARERIARGTQLVAHALEELIREAPTQWHLLQPNWPSDR